MSRKISISMTLAVVLVVVFAGFASAQTPEATDDAAPPAAMGCPYGVFIDADGDGLCDNYEYGPANQMWGPQWGAQGHHMGGMMQAHRNFVDEDEDGVCDNCDGTGSGPHGMQGGAGGRFSRQMGRQGMHSQGMNGTGMGNQNMGRGWGR